MAEREQTGSDQREDQHLPPKNILLRLITTSNAGKTNVETYTKSGTSNRHLDTIPKEMGA